MNTFKSILALSFLTSISFSCTKSSDELITGCFPSIPPIYLNFSIVESSTGQDLFFASTPTLGLKEMYFFKTKDVSRKDTIRPTIEGTGTGRTFKLLLDNSNLQDTLIMKVGTRPDDKLISKFKIIHEDCPIRVIDNNSC